MTDTDPTPSLDVEYVTVQPEALLAYRAAQHALYEAEKQYAAAVDRLGLSPDWVPMPPEVKTPLEAARRAVHAAYLVAFEGVNPDDVDALLAFGLAVTEDDLRAASRVAAMYFAEERQGVPLRPIKFARRRGATAGPFTDEVRHGS
jgi:hypothetical protein